MNASEARAPELHVDPERYPIRDMTQAALSQIESSEHKARKATREKSARAMGLALEQLMWSMAKKIRVADLPDLSQPLHNRIRIRKISHDWQSASKDFPLSIHENGDMILMFQDFSGLYTSQNNNGEKKWRTML